MNGPSLEAISLKTDDLDLVTGVVETSDPTAPSSGWPRGRTLALRLLAVVGAVAIYTLYRHLRVGAGRDVFVHGLPVQPFRHALTVLKVEHALGLDIEQGLQSMFLSHGLIIRFANAYYSWAHQWMTLGLLTLVLLKAPWTAAWQWVAALLLQLGVALVVFRLYPLMPPRLMDAGAPWGGRILEQDLSMRPIGMIDTLVQFHGPWSSLPSSVNSFTNQFAAAPSLHCGFAMWVGVVWWQFAKGHRWRILGPLHTATILFCVVVTGNHWVLDAVLGWVVALALLGVTGRLAGVQHVMRSYGRQGDSSRMLSTTSISQ